MNFVCPNNFLFDWNIEISQMCSSKLNTPYYTNRWDNTSDKYLLIKYLYFLDLWLIRSTPTCFNLDGESRQINVMFFCSVVLHGVGFSSFFFFLPEGLSLNLAIQLTWLYIAVLQWLAKLEMLEYKILRTWDDSNIWIWIPPLLWQTVVCIPINHGDTTNL